MRLTNKRNPIKNIPSKGGTHNNNTNESASGIDP
jgi:hypothetical protein